MNTRVRAGVLQVVVFLPDIEACRNDEMIFRKLLFVFLLVSFAFAAGPGNHFTPGDGRHAPFRRPRMSMQSSKVELDLVYDLLVRGKTYKINFVTLVPQTIPDRQTISSINYSPKPSRIFSRNGNQYAEFVFVNPKRYVKIKINVRAELFEYTIMTAIKNGEKKTVNNVELAEFLKQEKYIEKDNLRIQQAANGIEGRADLEKVLNIYDYVTEHMEYSIANTKALGAVNALKRGKGDCTEYSDLFVALCRAKNIPARVITGYRVNRNATSPKHNWLEVYLQKYGWVPFDPSNGDVGNVSGKSRVLNTGPVYLYYSHIRNDQVLDNYDFYAYKYLGDKPLFGESIKLKLPASSTMRKPQILQWYGGVQTQRRIELPPKKSKSSPDR
jgi:transglutaminase-like putative cysteine protease